MAEENKNTDQAPEPFRSIIFGTAHMFEPETRRIQTMGAYVTAGGGGIIMMQPDWETMRREDLTWSKRYWLWQCQQEARSFLQSLDVDVTKEHAQFIKSLHPEIKVYWVGDLSEVVL